MIITPWKCNQSSYVSYLPVYNSYYRQQTGKRTEAFLTTLGNQLVRASPQQETFRRAESCVHFTITIRSVEVGC